MKLLNIKFHSETEWGSDLPSHSHFNEFCLEDICSTCKGKGCEFCNDKGTVLTNVGQVIIDLIKKYL